MSLWGGGREVFLEMTFCYNSGCFAIAEAGSSARHSLPVVRDGETLPLFTLSSGAVQTHRGLPHLHPPPEPLRPLRGVSYGDTRLLDLH